MIVRDSNIFITHALLDPLSNSVPEITTHSIRIPAFDFSVWYDDIETVKSYDHAIIVFEDVVGSVRLVTPPRGVGQVEALEPQKITDGPFDRSKFDGSEEQAWLFHFIVYVISAGTSIGWHIAAASMQIEEIAKDAD